MKNVKPWGLSLVLLSLLPAGLAGAEEVTPGLKCHYTSVSHHKSGKSSEDWNGFWFAGDGGWIFRGNGKSAAGTSQLKGACGDGQCEFGQTWVSGKQKGQGRTYQHAYTGSLNQNMVLKLKFNGNWGQGNSYEADKNWRFKAAGKWQTSSHCQAVANIGDLPKVLGWDVW